MRLKVKDSRSSGRVLFLSSLCAGMLMILIAPCRATPFKGMSNLLAVGDTVPFGPRTPPTMIKQSLQNTSSDPLQFRSDGHILGFEPTKVYLVGMVHALTESFVGTRGVKPVAEGAPHYTIDKAPPLSSVTYHNLWKGIDLVYKPKKGAIAESLYRVAPKADPSQIRLSYNLPFTLAKDGSARFKKDSHGAFAIGAPTAWQERSGKRVSVPVKFRMESNNTLGFSLGSYDRSLPLFIDPDYTYEWHTFYGSDSTDQANSITVDGNGNVYVTGLSRDTWNGPHGEEPKNPYNASLDIFILKLSPTGEYQWHTFYGSDNDDYGMGVAVDGNGNVYVTGFSFASWNGPHNKPPLNNYTGFFSDMVVVKTYANGTYAWHTFYGSGNDYANSIAVDGNGNVCVTGISYAPWNGPHNQSPLNNYNNSGEIVVLKLYSNGNYTWHTFYGSSKYDEGDGIAVDGDGNIYVTGLSRDNWNGPQPQSKPPLHAYNQRRDIVVLKLYANGTYAWHTFYGSNDNDYGKGIAIDDNGNVYVTGYSRSSWNGPQNKAPLHAYSNGGSNMVVLKLYTNGTYAWHTFYGSGNDYAYGIAVDGGGQVYVTGHSRSSWNGPDNQLPLHIYNDDLDIAVIDLNADGAYQWHTFYGSSDEGHGIAVEGNGNLYVTGYGTVNWFGDGYTSPLHTHSGNNDIVVLKLKPGNTAISKQPGAPSGVSVSGISRSGSCETGCVASITLKWEYVQGAEGYLIYNADTEQLVKWVADGTVTSYTLHNLSCGRTYHFYIKAHSSYGNSKPSKTVTVQVPSCSGENPGISLVWPEDNSAINYNDFEAADYMVVFAWNKVENAKGYLLSLSLDDGSGTPVTGQAVLSASNGLIEAGDLAGIYFVLDQAGWNSLVPYTVTWQVSALSDPNDLNSIMGSSDKYSFTFNAAP